MREATDICHICDKVEPTPNMTYVDSENPNDDRLVCDECKNGENNNEEQTYVVDFGSITIGQDEYDKLTTDNDYARKWINDYAYIDQIIKD